jgi:hypothetical protein
MKNASDSAKVHAEFFIDGYRISGIFDARRRLLGDILYDPTTSYLEVQEAFLSPIGDPAHISNHYARAVLAKEKISLILTPNAKDGLRSDQRHYRGRYQTVLVTTLSFYDVTGELYTTSQFKLQTFLSIQAGPFISLLDATVYSAFHKDISYQGGIALVNASHISCIGEEQTRS